MEGCPIFLDLNGKFLAAGTDKWVCEFKFDLTTTMFNVILFIIYYWLLLSISWVSLEYLLSISWVSLDYSPPPVHRGIVKVFNLAKSGGGGGGGGGEEEEEKCFSLCSSTSPASFLSSLDNGRFFRLRSIRVCLKCWIYLEYLELL